MEKKPLPSESVLLSNFYDSLGQNVEKKWPLKWASSSFFSSSFSSSSPLSFRNELSLSVGAFFQLMVLNVERLYQSFRDAIVGITPSQVFIFIIFIFFVLYLFLLFCFVLFCIDY